MIIGIVAVDNKWAIGKDNHLLFNLPKDMEHFKKITTDSIVCMGYNTLLSLPRQKPLPNRQNVVLCPDGLDLHKDIIQVHSFGGLLAYIENMNDTAYIIGGGSVYEQMLPYYDKVIVTKVDADGEGTVFFPNLDDNKEFKIIEESKEILDGKYKTKYITYERIK